MSFSLDNVSKMVWEQCMGAKPDEKALIVTDPEGERLEIAEALESTCPCECRTMKMQPTGMAGREPSPEVAEAMLDADIVLAPTQHSMTWTNAAERSKARGARIVTLPGITKDIFLRTLPIDYGELEKINLKLMEILEKADDLRVSTKSGTDIKMKTEKGRIVCNGNGISISGKVTNLPAGEVYFAPKEGSSNGIVVFDLSALGEKLENPFRVLVKDGHATSCENDELWKILKGVENGTNLAELGIGTNPKAKITGNILEDEKVNGTAHIAFGTNAGMGGKIQTSIHLDSIFNKPTIEVEGKVIIREGKFLF